MLFTMINKHFENAIKKVVNKGIALHKCKEFNYSVLESFFEREKKIHLTATENKFQKTLTIDAYKDMSKVNNIVNTWRKSKLNYQNELRLRLETEKEAFSIIKNAAMINLNKSALKDLYHMCTELLNRNSIGEKNEIIQIIMNFTNMSQNNIIHRPSSGNTNSINTTTARIKKNFSFSKKHEDRPIITPKDKTPSINNSMQRESRMSGSDINTEVLLDYPTSVSAQSTNKVKHKRSIQAERIMGNPSSSNGFKLSQYTNSSTKTDKFNDIYGVKNNKAKRTAVNKKSASMKIGEGRIDSSKTNEVSLPYIQKSQNSSGQAHSVVNSHDLKWSPSKRKDKVPITGSLPKKPKQLGGSSKQSHKFVAIYSNSNQ
mmetsp:Transcript_26650/g.26541  ORF Transcript_26650/g.26541 Transcript_26650/m.26541 type:complete len:372 (+) Transcript_26650:525-1640(+)